jgi:hypothetical protein
MNSVFNCLLILLRLFLNFLQSFSHFLSKILLLHFLLKHFLILFLLFVTLSCCLAGAIGCAVIIANPSCAGRRRNWPDGNRDNVAAATIAITNWSSVPPYSTLLTGDSLFLGDSENKFCDFDRNQFRLKNFLLYIYIFTCIFFRVRINIKTRSISCKQVICVLLITWFVLTFFSKQTSVFYA